MFLQGLRTLGHSSQGPCCLAGVVPTAVTAVADCTDFNLKLILPLKLKRHCDSVKTRRLDEDNTPNHKKLNGACVNFNTNIFVENYTY